MVADSGLRMNRPGLKVFSKQSVQRQKQVFRTIHGASQVALLVKNQLANGGDIRDASSIPGSGRALEKGVATHFSVFLLENPMDGGAW